MMLASKTNKMHDEAAVHESSWENFWHLYGMLDNKSFWQEGSGRIKWKAFFGSWVCDASGYIKISHINHRQKH